MLLYFFKSIEKRKKKNRALDFLGGVWFVFSNNNFQFLNNIIHIFTHFFSIFKHTYQTGVCCLLIVTIVSCFVELAFKVYNVIFSSWLLVLNL